jgi:hypothetical protein
MKSYFEFLKKLLTHFSDLALVIQLSFIVIAACIVIIVLSFILISISRYRKRLRDKRESKLDPLFDKYIYNYISFDNPQFSENEFSSKESIVREIKKHTYRRKNLQLFLDHLIGFKKTFAGNMSNEINELFYDAGLQSFCLKKLFKLARYKKIKGLTEFIALGIPLADVYIIPLTHSRARSVRITARYAYIKLSKNNPFSFFDSSKEELLTWEQIELFQIITTNEQLIIPNFSSWISYSENASIIKFCLQLVAHYHQSEALHAVQRLLDSKDPEIRSATIECLGKMKNHDHEDKMIHIYFEQPLSCQLAILDALGRIASGRYVDFLINEFKNGSEFEIRKAAAKALIRNINRDPLEEGKIVSEILEHASDEQRTMINYYRYPILKSA